MWLCRTHDTHGLLTLLGSGETLTEQNCDTACVWWKRTAKKRCRSWQGTVSVSPARESPSSRKQWTAHLLRRYPEQYHHHRGRARRYRQNISGGGHGGNRFSGSGSQPYYPDASCCGSGGENWVSCPAIFSRRWIRIYARCMTRCLICWGGNLSALCRTRKHRGGAACLYARQDSDDSFIILDEAQNTTTEQMKMF